MKLSVFSLLPLAATVFAAPAPATTQTVIHPTSDKSKCLVAASNADGAAVEIKTCVTGAHPESVNQLWTITGGAIQIFGDKCLDDTNGVTTNGQKMQIWTCTGGKNQKWAPTRYGSIALTSYTSSPGKCLDNTDGKQTDGNPVQIWDCTGGPNQAWTPENVQVTPPPPTNGVTIQTGLKAGECLTAASNADNAAVTIQNCNGSAAQAWNVTSGTSTTGGNIRIFGDKCLDVPNGSTANGVKMQIFTCFSGNTNQLFSVTADNRIAWTNMHNCLDVTDGNTNPGTPAQMYHCTANDNNQVWHIV